MKKRKKIFYIISIIFIILQSCADVLNPEDKTEPCFDCPIDFRLIDKHPAWSPDGTEIAYEHSDTTVEKNGIYIINVINKSKRKLLSNPYANNPSWSPDGKWLAIEIHGQIYKIKSNGDNLAQLTFEGRNYFPAWSPDNNWIAYDSNKDNPDGGYRIWKMNIYGNGKELLVGGRMADWTNTAESIVYIGFHGEIFQVDLQNITQIEQITKLNKNDIYATDNRFPKFSWNGNKIAFTSQPADKFRPRIWIINDDGTNLYQLTDTQSYTCDWSPDGSKIVYTDARGVNGYLWIIDVKSGFKEQLTFNEN